MQKPLLLLTILFMAIASVSAQQTIYFDIDPDYAVPKDDAYALNLAKDPANVGFGEDGSFILWNYNTGIFLVTYSDCEVLMDGNLPAALNNGDQIDSTGIWNTVNYASLYDGTTGHWKNASDLYLGIRFKKNNAWYYGWVRLDVNATGDEALVKDYAYKDQAGTEILAGDQASVGLKSFGESKSLTYRVTNNLLTITSDHNPASLHLFDMHGKEVRYSGLLQGQAPQLDLQNIQPGIYVLLLSEEEGESITRKIYINSSGR